MSTWETVAALVLSHLGVFVVGAVWWHKTGADDREQDLTIRYNEGFATGQKAGYVAGLAEQASIQKAKDSARAKKAARTRHSKRVA